MRRLSLLFIVLVLGCMQVFTLESGDRSRVEHDSIEQIGKDVEITASLSRSTIYVTLSTKLKNKKDQLSDFLPFTGINRALPFSQFFYVDMEFICAVFINLFPRKYQSNYLPQ